MSVPPNSAAITMMPGKTNAWYGRPLSSLAMALYPVPTSSSHMKGRATPPSSRLVCRVVAR